MPVSKKLKTKKDIAANTVKTIQIGLKIQQIHSEASKKINCKESNRWIEQANKINECVPQTYKWNIGSKSSTSVLCLTTVRWRVKAIVVVHKKDATQKKCVLYPWA